MGTVFSPNGIKYATFAASIVLLLSTPGAIADPDVVLVAGATRNFACDEASDNDLYVWVEDDVRHERSEVDSGFSYAWTATGGSFPSGSTGRSVSWTAPSPGGDYTVTVTASNPNTDKCADNGVDSCQVRVIGVQGLEYKVEPGGSYTTYSTAITVAKGTQVTFRPVITPSGASWPPSEPTWGGTAGASGWGLTKSVTFNTVSTSTSDYKTVTVECGTSSNTAEVLVVDIDKIRYDIGSGYVDAPVPSAVLYLPKDTAATFQAVIKPSGASWPTDKPVWSGVASGSGATKAVTFSTTSTSTTDFKTVTVQCGNTKNVNVIVWELDKLTATGATAFGVASPPTTYTTAQQDAANVTITAEIKPAVTASNLPANSIVWTDGEAGANQLQRLVSRAVADTSVTVVAKPTARPSKSLTIYVRRVQATNSLVTPTQSFSWGSSGNNFAPAYPVLTTWHLVSVGNNWMPRIDVMTCSGSGNIQAWASAPTTMTTPNTANPVVGGNINNTVGSWNRWSYASGDLANYSSGGAGPHWHRTAASSAHEHYHANVDWMNSCVATAGDWAGTEIDIEAMTVPWATYLTEAQARAALLTQVNARFLTHGIAAAIHWNSVIIPADRPGGGGGAYAAGAAVLANDISSIESFRVGQGW